MIELSDLTREERELFESRGFTGVLHRRPVIFGLMLASALISLVAAVVLSFDALELAKNPAAKFSCDLSAVISCGKVAATWQAELFGFPNAFLGLICESVVITIAAASLGGARFPRWFMAAAQFVYLLGLIFAYWLFSQSYLVIGAFCPWCLLITLGTTIVFFELLRYNIMARNLPLGRLQSAADSFVRSGFDSILCVLMLSTVVALIVVRYGAYLI